MNKKVFYNQEEYREYLNKMFEQAKRIGATKERLKDYKNKDNAEIELHIAICNDGFHVYQKNKTFMCQTGEQLISYLKTMEISKRQMLEIQELLLSECMKLGIEFPTDLID